MLKRPLVGVALAWAAGLYAAGAWGVPASVGLLLVPVVILGGYFARRLPHARSAAIPATFLALGVAYWNLVHAGPPGDALGRMAAETPGDLVVVTGVVRNSQVVLPESTYARFVVDVDRVRADGTWRPVNGATLVRWSQPGHPLFAGERVQVRGRIFAELGPVNHGIWRIEDTMRARGVHSTLRTSGKNIEQLGVHRASPAYWASRLRQAQARRFAEHLPERVLPFVMAVWLGERAMLDPGAYDAYIHSGTAHILAVSGIHMAIVFASMQFLLGLCIPRGRVRSVVILAAVVLFALTAGARVSSLRAATMIGFYLAADLVRRERDAPTALAVSALCFLLAQPRLLFDTAFLLSFSSVSSILLFMGPIETWLRGIPPVLGKPLASTLAVQLLPLPLAIHFFHVLPLGAPLANIVVIPLLGLALWLCFFASAAAFALPLLAGLVGHALLAVTTAIRACAEAVTGPLQTHVALTSPSMPAAMLYWAALGCMALAAVRREQRRRWVLLMAGALAWSVLLWRPWQLPAEVHFLDVAAADAAFVRTPGGETLLIDGGERSTYRDDGAYVVLPFLYAHHVTRLDYIAVSHPDQDHIGGLFHIVERMPVGCVLLAENPGPEPGRYAALRDRCEELGIPVRHLEPGDTLPLAGARLETLHPPAGWTGSDSVNDYSLTLRLTWPGLALLFTGDVEGPAERLLAELDCRADVLKVPHHGSNTSSSQELLDAVRPRHAVISTGAARRGSAAHPEVVDRLERAGARIWRTDTHGGLRLRIRDGQPVFVGARVLRGYR